MGSCRACPSLCKSCESADVCTSCLWGSLIEGKCVESSNYKNQTIEVLDPVTVCSGDLMSLANKQN